MTLLILNDSREINPEERNNYLYFPEDRTQKAWNTEAGSELRF